MRDGIRYVLIALLALVAAGAAQARELKYNLFVPSNSIEHKRLIEFFAEVKQATNGGVTGRIFPGGQLLSGPATLKGLADGVADIGFNVPAFNQAELPHVNIIPDMVGYGTDPMTQMAASNDTVMKQCEKCRQDFEKLGLAFFGGHVGTSWDLMCTKPAGSLAELKGLKVRVPGGAATRLVESLGLVAVNMTPGEAATALAGGQLDCVSGSTVWMADYSYWDRAKYHLDADLGVSAGLGIFVWNAKTWNALGDPERAALRRLMPKYLALMTQDFIDRENEVLRQAPAKGVKLLKPDAGIRQALAAYRQKDRPNLIEGMRKRGADSPDKIMAQFEDSQAKWTKRLDASGRDAATVGELMYKESFQ
jgi:TRAP-type C4-dicarboxylate transport system substrate-binding protein